MRDSRYHDALRVACDVVVLWLSAPSLAGTRLQSPPIDALLYR